MTYELITYLIHVSFLVLILSQKMEEDKKHLIFAMMHFLEQELLRSDLTPDSKESIEGIADGIGATFIYQSLRT